jgi:DNA polymerase-3 subunit epsilon
MREIVLDTETTGLYPLNGDRLVEIGCLELKDCIPTGRTYQQYINPLRQMSPKASEISGITSEFVLTYPTFDKIVDDFLDFIGEDASLVIHNAPFDIGFLNMELERLGRPPIAPERVIDTLKMARETVRSSGYSLDALCEKFEIDKSMRTLHGALIDCELLAKVYLELQGGRQRSFSFAREIQKPVVYPDQGGRAYRSFTPSELEKTLHEKALDEIKNALWLRQPI